MRGFFSCRFSRIVGSCVALLCASVSSLDAWAAEGNCVCSPEQTSKAFTAVAKKAMPAVLFIKVQSVVSDQEDFGSSNPYGYQNPFDFNDDFFNRFFGGVPRQPPKQAPQVSQGSGFLVT